MKQFKKSYSLASLSAAVLFGTVIAIPQTALACGQDAYIGQICMMAGQFCPKGTAEARGQTVSVSDNPALFSLIGCTYGGDCRSTMAYPDLRGRTPAGLGQGPGLTEFRMGDRYGDETIVQSVQQMPSHSHEAEFTPNGGTTGGGTATGVISLPVTGSAKIATSNTSASYSQTPSDHAVLGTATQGRENVNLYTPAGTIADLNIGPDGAVTGTASGTVSLPVTGGGSGGTVEVGVTGSGQAMPVVGPRIAMRYCMVTDGVYPPRPN